MLMNIAPPAEYDAAVKEAFARAGRPDSEFFASLIQSPWINPLNHKYYRRLAAKDWLLTAEGARDFEPCAFLHPRIKSHFVRYYGPTAFNLHYMEVHSRADGNLRAKPELIDQAETHIAGVIEKSAGEVTQYLNASEALIAEAGGECGTMRYGAPPLFVPAEIISPYCVLYLQLLMQADKLMSMLEYQKLRAIIRIAACDREFARVDRLLKAVERSAFQLARGLRKRARGELEPASGGAKAVRPKPADRPTPPASAPVAPKAQELEPALEHPS